MVRRSGGVIAAHVARDALEAIVGTGIVGTRLAREARRRVVRLFTRLRRRDCM